jgi:glycosyltransferase involved in cell wall biosynthesis
VNDDKMILGLFVGMFDYGGIERVSRYVAAVLTSFAQEHGYACRILCLNDPVGKYDFEVAGQTFTVEGFGRNKIRFIKTILSNMLQTKLVFAGHPNFGPLALFQRAIRPKTRYIIYTYGVDVWEPLPLFRRWGLMSSQLVAAISNHTAQCVIEKQGVDPCSVALLHPPLSPNFFLAEPAPIPKEMDFQKDAKILLTVARLSRYDRDKGVETVLRTIPEIVDVIPNSHYVIVGDGDDRPRLEELTKELGISSCVTFVGAIKGELTNYYRMCDVFVMPSRKEGYGIVFVEAMALGKPVVGGMHGGTPDIVIDGQTGYLVEYGDLETLKTHLIDLLSDESLRKKMGRKGKNRLEKMFVFQKFRAELNRMLKRLENFYG